MDVIRSLDDLTAWIDAAPGRHAKTGEHSCSCGWRDDMCWTPDGYVPYEYEHRSATWEHHTALVHLADLGDVIPSDCSEAGRSLVWREYANWLAGCLDRSHEADDVLHGFVRLLAEGSIDDPEAAARNTLDEYAEVVGATVPQYDGQVIPDRSSSGEQPLPPSPPDSCR